MWYFAYSLFFRKQILIWASAHGSLENPIYPTPSIQPSIQPSSQPSILSPAQRQENIEISPVSQLEQSKSIQLEDENQVLYPQFLSSLRVSVEVRSATISVVMSKEGMLHCAAFQFSSFVIPSLSYIRYFGVAKPIIGVGMSTINGINATIHIPKLEAYTVYDFICYTDDFAANAMTLDVAISFKKTISTLCCGEITLLQDQLYILSTGGSYDSEYNFSVSPITDLLSIVNTTWVSVDCMTLKVDKNIPIPQQVSSGYLRVSPSAFFFTPRDLFPTRSFTIQADPGCYKVTLYSVPPSAGRNAQRLTQYANHSFDVVVLKYTSKINRPRVASAKFSNSGMGIIVDFDVPTNMGSFFNVPNFNCSLVLKFRGICILFY